MGASFSHRSSSMLTSSSKWPISIWCISNTKINWWELILALWAVLSILTWCKCKVWSQIIISRWCILGIPNGKQPTCLLICNNKWCHLPILSSTKWEEECPRHKCYSTINFRALWEQSPKVLEADLEMDLRQIFTLVETIFKTSFKIEILIGRQVWVLASAKICSHQLQTILGMAPQCIPPRRIIIKT